MKKETKQTVLLLERQDYISPDCNIINIEAEHFICTSVKPNAPDSQEPDYDPDEDIDGGEHEFE